MSGEALRWEAGGQEQAGQSFSDPDPDARLPSGRGTNLLVIGAVHDPRVLLHEPDRWVAAVRAADPGWSPRCLFRVETGSGAHTGPGGRYGRLHYEVEVAAWLRDALGVFSRPR